MAVKRDKYDAVFSDLVRERVDHTCERCNIHIPEGMRMSSHCAHIHGRKSQATRYDPDNALCLCAKDHYYFTDHPTEFAAFLRDYLGEGHLEIIREKSHSIKKWYKGEKDEMRKHYQQELKRIRADREKGIVGRIEVTGW